MAISSPSPINTSKSVLGTAIQIHHGKKSWKIVLFRITIIRSFARNLKFPPQHPIINNQQRVLSSQHEELGSNTKLLKGNLRHHGEATPRIIPLPKMPFFRHNLNKTLESNSHTEMGQLGF